MAGNGAGGISAMNTPQIDPLLPMPEVVSATGISRSSIYAGIKAGTFPRPVKVGAHASRWPSSRIAAWIEERKAESTEVTASQDTNQAAEVH